MTWLAGKICRSSAPEQNTKMALGKQENLERNSRRA
jgi:hypothetical protein